MSVCPVISVEKLDHLVKFSSPDHSIIINKLSVGCLILLHEHKTTITTIKGPYFRVTFFSVEIAA